MPELRGTFYFQTAGDGILDTAGNVEALRRLWLDRTLIHDDDLGPGDDGDFDNGAWHVSCHVAGAAGVRRARDGRLLWLEISHNPGRDEYFASVTADKTHPLDSSEGRALVEGSTLLGFVEGNSTGHISARGVNDPPTRFNKWQRQSFDRAVDSAEDGGKVWEHWCTLRDIRPAQPVAASVLRAYVALMAALGDRFVAAVARGRRDYHHPRQLCALVRAGVTTEAAATWDVSPIAIPSDIERHLLEAKPVLAAKAIAALSWNDNAHSYYMFERRIARWSTASAVRRDLRTFAR